MFDTGYDVGIYRERRKRKIRRAVIFIAFIFCFVEFIGLPQLRMRPERKPAYYVGFAGAQRAHITRKAPLVVLMPLKRSLVHYAKNAASNIWGSIQVSK